MKSKFFWRSLFFIGLAATVIFSIQIITKVDATKDELTLKQNGGEFVLESAELGAIRHTPREIKNAKLVHVGESSVQVVTWTENDTAKGDVPFYAISLDGKTIAKVQETSYDVNLKYAQFEPLKTVPEVQNALKSNNQNDENGAYIVQFITQPLEEYRAEIRALGGKDFIYLSNHAHLVIMNAETRSKVEKLPFVRWVGRYEPAYKIEEFLREKLTGNLADLPPGRYNIMVLERGEAMQNKLGNRIRTLGGKVENIIPEGFRMEATLTAEQLLQITQENEILYLDRWSAPEKDMDLVREVGGANFISDTLGYKGEGVRAEVLDAGVLTTHTDFNSGLPLLAHGANNVDSHGTATYGINFGRGTTNPLGRGMLPEAQGIFADYDSLTNRYTHTAELKQAPYRAVYQSNSWGSTLTTAYTTISSEMDDILFINDFVLLNSQSNAGTQSSRPQAWAKNVVSIGGMRHFNTATFDDDRWQNGASIGPAADGRIKPDLAHFYDSVNTTTSTSNTAYTTGFGGTSAATPITAGHFGIFFQMWHNGIFGNPTGATVFDSAPKMTTTKAIMINTATQWSMDAPSDATRIRQGWGRADLRNLYNLRQKMLVINETDVLTPLQTRSYTVTVPTGSTDPLKVTMVFADPRGNPAATQARINDLSLKVTAPNGTIYHGNNGLLTSQWSTSGGVPNTIDTVENVYVQSPQAGNWRIDVTASEINQDARTETPAIDADFALVASGLAQTVRKAFDYDGDGKDDVSVFRPGQNVWHLLRSTTGYTTQPFGLAADKITPADYDGDGKTDIAVFRDGTWYILRSNTGFTSIQWGNAGDIAAPADYDGDGKADLAVFRNGIWYVLKSTGGVQTTQWGIAGDAVVAGDYNGDAKADFAVFRNGFWYILNNGGGFQGYQWGATGDKAVPADYDGDGKMDIAVFRSGVWYVLRSNLGSLTRQWGISTDSPVPADYDGDGKADFAVFRNGVWYQLNSTSGSNIVSFGLPGDVPTESAYIR